VKSKGREVLVRRPCLIVRSTPPRPWADANLPALFLGFSGTLHATAWKLNKEGKEERPSLLLPHYPAIKSHVSTTMAYYILPDHKRAKAGLKKLGQVAERKYGIKV
jgi:hypothetical protein